MLYKMEEWQDATGRWHCNCVSNLGKNSGYWTHPARMMKITPANYVEWLIKNYHPEHITYSKDRGLVFFCWDKQSDMRKFKNKINAIARQVNYQI